MPTEQIPVTRSDRSPDDDDDLFDPVELPEIVPATEDEEDDSLPVARSAPSLPAVIPAEGPDDDERDPVGSWVEPDERPVVVAAPNPSTVGPLRAVGRRPRVRKVTRVVRHLDPWSVFKVAIVFSAVLYGVALTSGVLLWNVALSTGTIDNVERWFTQFGWETFELNGGEIYHNAWIAGLFAAVGLTGVAVLLATIFNLVSDMVGGVRVTVLEEEVVERTTSPARRYVVRRVPTDPGGVQRARSAARTSQPRNGG